MAWHGTSLQDLQPHGATQHLAKRNVFTTTSLYPIHCLDNPPAHHHCSGFNCPQQLLGNELFQVGHDGVASAHVGSGHPYSAWEEVVWVACILDLLLHLAQRDKH